MNEDLTNSERGFEERATGVEAVREFILAGAAILVIAFIIGMIQFPGQTFMAFGAAFCLGAVCIYNYVPDLPRFARMPLALLLAVGGLIVFLGYAMLPQE